MPLTKSIKFIHEPTDLQCGQAVLAMLSDKSVDEIIDIVKTDRETDLKQMFFCLDACEISYIKERKQAQSKEQLPPIALLSLETPRCWHWSLYYKGKFYDPEHNLSDDFPQCKRKYFWEIKEK